MGILPPERTGIAELQSLRISHVSGLVTDAVNRGHIALTSVMWGHFYGY
jgi:hypothetical protein